MTTLDQAQCAYVRMLLFQELHEAAESLAELALDASEHSNPDKDAVAGDNTRALLHKRVLVIADLLDSLGWSILHDVAGIVELESRHDQKRAE